MKTEPDYFLKIDMQNNKMRKEQPNTKKKNREGKKEKGKIVRCTYTLPVAHAVPVRHG
jgi:hypothetical protein